MNKSSTVIKDKRFVLFTIRFIAIFAFCYFGTLAMIGLAAPGGYYVPFIHDHLDYVSWIKGALIWGTRGLLAIFGIQTYTAPDFVVRIVNGTGVKIAYDCVGYGVMSFWIAFVCATKGSFSRKITWSLAGIIILWLINVLRISLLLVAYNRHWGMPLRIDHHTWFTIVAYIAIFTMIYLFERIPGNKALKKQPEL